MKAENKLIYKVIMYLLLFLCAICISFHMTFYGVQSVQEIQDSHFAYVNDESNNSGDGNNNTLMQKIISNILNHINSNSKSDLLFYVAGIFSTITLFIHMRECYFNEQDYLSNIYKSSLIA